MVLDVVTFTLQDGVDTQLSNKWQNRSIDGLFSEWSNIDIGHPCSSSSSSIIQSYDFELPKQLCELGDEPKLLLVALTEQVDEVLHFGPKLTHLFGTQRHFMVFSSANEEMNHYT